MVATRTMEVDLFRLEDLADEAGGVIPPFLWDFGTFTCLGSEDAPKHVVGQNHPYHLIVSEIGIRDLRGAEPFRSTSHPVYTYDYGAYVQTELAYADVVFTPNGVEDDMEAPSLREEAYRIGDEIPIEGGGDNQVLQSADPIGSHRIAISVEKIENAVERGEWKAALALRK